MTRPDHPTPQRPDANPPPAGLACALDALAPDERARHAAVQARLGRLVLGIDELADGFALRLPASGAAIATAAEFVRRERRCCPFFDFDLRVPAHGGPARLALTGGPGVKDFLRAQLPAGGQTASDWRPPGNRGPAGRP